MSDSPRQHPCQCCGFHALAEPVEESHAICAVCYWEDGRANNDGPVFSEGAHPPAEEEGFAPPDESARHRVSTRPSETARSLSSARDAYVRLGASAPEFIGQVRAPRLEEIPGPVLFGDLEKLTSEPVLRSLKTRMLGIARGILSREIEVLSGSLAITAIGSCLPDPMLTDSLSVFGAVADRVFELSAEAERTGGSGETLDGLSAQVEELERSVARDVDAACELLQERLIAELI